MPLPVFLESKGFYFDGDIIGSARVEGNRHVLHISCNHCGSLTDLADEC